MQRYRFGRRGVAGVAAVGLAWSVWSEASVAASRQQAGPGATPISSGVYSEPQASRGLLAYTRSCEHCHGPDLTGDPIKEIPALVADAFMFHWRGRTVLDLYNHIGRTMPADGPGSLEPRVYLDLVAYVLEANGFPRGAHDLDRDRLGGIVIERTGSP